MLDLFILIVIAWSLISGWRAGLLKEVISSVGFLIGLLVAATCYNTLGEYLSVSGTESNMMTSVIAFFLLWIVAPIVLGFVANLLTKGLKGLRLGWINSSLGALVSLVKYIVLLSCVLNVMGALHIIDEQKTGDSHLFSPVSSVVTLLVHEIVSPQQNAPAQDSVQSDTVWVDVSHKS